MVFKIKDTDNQETTEKFRNKKKKKEKTKPRKPGNKERVRDRLANSDNTNF